MWHRTGRRAVVAVSACVAVTVSAPLWLASPAHAASGLHRIFTLSFESGLPSTLADGTVIRSEVGPRATLLLGGGAASLPVVRGYHGGSAVQLPGPCQGSGCPKAVLRVGPDTRFRPGTGDLRWGARVRLTAGQTSAGSNIVQKGLSTDRGGQWKLQIDGTTGRPSCVMVATGSTDIHLALSRVSVSDGTWHRVVCRRTGTLLRVRVDGDTTGSVSLPAGLDVRPVMRVRIGAKGLETNNDQYFGRVDDVFVGAER